MNLIVKRILQAIPTLLIIATLTFILMKLTPGGPFDDEKSVSPEVKKLIESHYGMDKPIIEQYIFFLSNRLKGDFGPSYKYIGWDVHEIIAQSFPASLELGIYSLIISIIIGLPLGIAAALNHKRITETFLMGFSLIGICLPVFVLGPILIMVFSTNLGWVNPFGWYSFSDKILPSLTLGLFYAAFIARLTRSGMLDALKNQYIQTARAKGLSEIRIIFVHTLRTALTPVISYLGPAIAGMISGSFVIETLFFIPGLGSFFVNSAFNRDYTMVMGTVLFYAFLIIIFNLLVDIVQMWMNPKIKNEN